MKKITAILITVLTAATTITFAQPHHGKPHHGKEHSMEKMKAHKIAYITTELDLSTKDAEKFWPIYNEMEDKRMEIMEERKNAMKAMKAKKEEGTLKDADIEKNIQLNFEMEQKELDLKKSYHKQFKEVLTMEQVGQLYMAERKFHKELMKRLSHEEHKGEKKH